MTPPRFIDSHAAVKAAFAVTAVAAALACIAAAAVFTGGSQHGSIFELTRATALVLIFIDAIALAVIAYAARALHGDPRLGTYAALLALAAAASVALTVCSNLIAAAAAWLAIGVTISALLYAHRERPAAQRAAAKHVLADALGGAGIVLAAGTLWAAGVTRFDGFAAAFAAPNTHGSLLALAAFGILLAVTSRCALVPLHVWLADSMETPAPGAALIHSVLVASGGVLIVRCAVLFSHEPAALNAFALLGALTAAFGANCMLVRPERKRKLAYSTVAQIGFMIMQCGLGLFAAAIVHLIGHGLYKASRLLSAGEAIEDKKNADGYGHMSGVRPAFAVPAALLAACGAVRTQASFAGTPLQSALAWSLAAATVYFGLRAARGPQTVVLSVAGGTALGALYLAGVDALGRVLAADLGPQPGATGPAFCAAAAVVLATLFGIARDAFGRLLVPAIRDRWYVFTLNEGYAGELWRAAREPVARLMR